MEANLPVRNKAFEPEKVLPSHCAVLKKLDENDWKESVLTGLEKKVWVIIQEEYHEGNQTVNQYFNSETSF